MKIKTIVLLITGVLILSYVKSQNIDSVSNNKICVFIDCSSCNINYFKENLTFINYARDVKDADVYILITSQITGSRGEEYTFTFNGAKNFKGLNDTLKLYFLPDNTEDEIRTDQINFLKMGLVRYIVRTSSFKNFSVENISSSEIDNTNLKDKWKSWIFNISLTGILTGQEAYSSSSFGSSITVNRITQDWKIMNDYSTTYNESKYKIDDTTTIINKQTENAFTNLSVKSIGEHWSVGEKLKIKTSSFDNLKFNIEVSPALEYDLFKYSESTRKQLRFLYSIGTSYFKYNDTTIFNKVEETLFLQKLNISLDINQKWGLISLSAIGSAYLHDFSKNNLSFSCNSNIRILKGLSFNINAGFSFIRDQLSLPKSDATPEQILLQQRAIATNYSFSVIAGLSYTFGSANNNVVNPRFGE